MSEFLKLLSEILFPILKKTHLGEITSDGRFPVEEKITHRG